MPLTAAIHRLGLAAAPGLVAVSGGADSVALLFALRAAGLAVTAAHFHHHIRGAAADADAAFVEALAARLGVAFVRGDGDAPAAGGSLEAAARRLRYGWLAAAATERGAAWVSTGHTADDQAETVLLNLARGTGLRGLRGVAEVRELAPGVQLVRPALGVRRGQLRAVLTALGEPHREDESNADARFARGRVRATLLPALEALNPNAVPALARLAGQSASAQLAADAVADAVLRAVELPCAGPVVVLDRAALARVTPADRAAVLRRLWEREGWPADRLTAAALGRAAESAVVGTAGVDLPGGVRLVAAGGVVRVGPGS